MRAALSILGLVIAFAFLLSMMKKQAVSLTKVGVPASAASAASGAGAAQNMPDAVRQQLQDAAQQAAQRASEAMP
ncbi:hypothetical protein LNV08_02460 [Paucibacter sp. TC2R-5]|uniref:hypothetical protein n=1 Tax=Paucibacter sp. TC2R-5 TaxID=2893555 RepID=UPI0021E42E3E|nr:hypothetical protein [Paucibacter sp. TC2R-5]MCV2357830.1 hypothetical protein [Paucibacter sp. TC2R-5]